MKNQEYIKRNLQGYEGDENIHLEIKRLVDLHKIDTIIETGTYLGGTTVRFAELVTNVITIESDTQSQKTAYNDRLKNYPNVWSILAHSQDVLSETILNNVNNLFFLDAHWENFCPLLQELQIIANEGIKPVIVIHDFKVPNRPELGYDSYKGQDFTFEWIKPSLDAIYGDGGYNYNYNGKAEGAMRGVIYIEPLATVFTIEDKAAPKKRGRKPKAK
jgi:predicted O-methyltransferase YrrM